MKSKPADSASTSEQELISIDLAIREATHQREESGNLFKHHASEANRLQLRIEKKDPSVTPETEESYKKHISEAHRQKDRIEKLDAKLKELEAKKT